MVNQDVKQGLGQIGVQISQTGTFTALQILNELAEGQRTEFVNVLREELVGVGDAGVEVAKTIVTAQSRRLTHKSGGVVRGEWYVFPAK